MILRHAQAFGSEIAQTRGARRDHSELNRTMRKALTIAGSDSGGGAGIQADLKTFAAFGVYGTSAITALTAQNTQGITAILELPPDFIAKQIDAVMTDIGADVWKTGMLANPEIVNIVAERAKYYKVKSLVVDPVMVAKNGALLFSREAKTILIKKLIPQALVITPNCYEAKTLTGLSIKNIEDMKKAAVAIYKMGARNVVVKGGHLNKSYKAIDIVYDGNKFSKIISPRLNTKNTHGTGCTYASAIAAGIAKGCSVLLAIRKAKRYLNLAIKKASRLYIGQGFGPLDHFPKIKTK